MNNYFDKNNSTDGINPYDNHEISLLKEIWEPRKEYIEKDLWVIRGFLSEEELDWLNELANDPKDWYTTMRSPYGGNTKNKFIGYVAEHDDDGKVLLPGPNSKHVMTRWNTFPINSRVESVVLAEANGVGALQSFFEVPDEQIIAELGYDVDYAMDFHYERDDEEKVFGKPATSTAEGKITAAYSIYINDDYDGGILEFKNKEYSIRPEPGMLVNIPLYKEFEHRITKVRNGNRHTLYGRSWDSLSQKHLSTSEDC
jgi:hypothetical protein